MNLVEAGRFLAAVMIIDPKFAKPDDIGLLRATWADWLSDVPYEAARRAMRAYYRSEAYATHREPIAPANIVGWWSARRPPTEAERTGTTATNRRELPAPPRDPDRIRAGVDSVRATLLAGGTPRSAAPTRADPSEVVAEQRARRAHPCGHCGAEAGRPCVDVRGHALTRTDAHPSRSESTAGSSPRGSVDQARQELTTGGTPS